MVKFSPILLEINEFNLHYPTPNRAWLGVLIYNMRCAEYVYVTIFWRISYA